VPSEKSGVSHSRGYASDLSWRGGASTNKSSNAGKAQPFRHIRRQSRRDSAEHDAGGLRKLSGRFVAGEDAEAAEIRNEYK